MEQLQQTLNKAIEIGWKPRGYNGGLNGPIAKVSDNGNDMWYGSGAVLRRTHIHSLFSKDSGLMEFVKWRNMDIYTAYIVMSDKTAQCYDAINNVTEGKGYLFD